MATRVVSDPPTVEIDAIKPQNDSPLFTELVAELGHDPLDRMHSSYDDFHLASEIHAEAMEHLRKLVTDTTE